MSRWTPKTKRIAKLILPLIDPLYWAESSIDKERFHRANDDRTLMQYYMAEGRRFPQKITKTPLDAHYTGGRLIHYASNRASGRVLVRFDLDAHHGEDGMQEAEALVRRYLPSSYSEASCSGTSRAVFAVVEIGRLRRARFNELLVRVRDALEGLYVMHQINIKVEVQGGFHLRPYIDQETGELTGEFVGTPLGCLPLCRTDAEVDALLSLSPCQPADLRRIIDNADERYRIETEGQEEREEEEGGLEDPILLEDCASRTRPRSRNLSPKPQTDDAFARMNWACYEYTLTHHRLPDLRELLDTYQSAFGGSESDGRVRRAMGVLKLRSKRYDPSQGNGGGYQSRRDELLALVRAACTRRTSRYKNEITDEDLAVALYLYEINSFTVRDDPKRQYTVSRTATVEMFRTLKMAQISTRGCNLNKGIALKHILKENDMIRCIDDQVVPTGKNGISQKWVIGPSHPMHDRFQKVFATTPVVYVKQLRARKRPETMPDPAHIDAKVSSAYGTMVPTKVDDCRALLDDATPPDATEELDGPLANEKA